MVLSVLLFLGGLYLLVQVLKVGKRLVRPRAIVPTPKPSEEAEADGTVPKPVSPLQAIGALIRVAGVLLKNVWQILYLGTQELFAKTMPTRGGNLISRAEAPLTLAKGEVIVMAYPEVLAETPGRALIRGYSCGAASEFVLSITLSDRMVIAHDCLIAARANGQSSQTPHGRALHVEIEAIDAISPMDERYHIGREVEITCTFLEDEEVHMATDLAYFVDQRGDCAELFWDTGNNAFHLNQGDRIRLRGVVAHGDGGLRGYFYGLKGERFYVADAKLVGLA